ncbi:hypothetical protein Arub01_17300 [Actinomadura rubrobrunea]|uniref:DUF2470 domain-containing protein n=1 Tax=Actinomadura rubrobrunea TaxID=115335 RepID=A0A9W6PUZ8_9ACTN|nr:DUF2470 domain-containing protein [Actinomadura rubrobrunea]GLW63486.1 hypothetical protein Arub01_17300 [Actinomadura rubrobrunea]
MSEQPHDRVGAPRRGRAPRPTAGERARTLAYGIADGVLAVPGVPYAPVPAHVTDDDGRPLLLAATDSPVAAALRGEPDLPATLRICDVAPVPFPDRVRGRAWLHGWLTEVPAAERPRAAALLARLHPRPEVLAIRAGVPPVRSGDRGGADGADAQPWTILALEVAEVEIDDAWGSAALEPEVYADAAPDPFAAVEAGVLCHLDGRHRDELAFLLRGLAAARAARGPEGLADVGTAATVRPLALDRYGMWLRCSRPGGPDGVGGPRSTDVRMVFPEPVSDLHGLRRAYRRLFAAASRRPAPRT